MSVHSTLPRSERGTRLRLDPFAAAGAVLGLGCAFVGQYVATPWHADAGNWEVRFADGGGYSALAALVGFVVVGLLVVSLFTTSARAVELRATARRALGLAVAGVLSLVVFWTALPAVLAGGALGLALDARRRLGRTHPLAAAAAVLAVLIVAAAVWLAVTG